MMYSSSAVSGIRCATAVWYRVCARWQAVVCVKILFHTSHNSNTGTTAAAAVVEAVP